MRLALERNANGRRELVLHRGEPILRETPSPGTEITLQPQISAFWQELAGTVFSPNMIEFIWVAERCIQLNAQSIATMPLRFVGNGPASREPAWLSNPDPVWYPNGIGDAVFSAVDDFYRRGDIFLYTIGDYADGFPSAWTVLDAATVIVDAKNGRRTYKIGEDELDSARVVQISRNPRPGRLRGTSALKSYAEMVNAATAATIQGANAMNSLPPAVLQASMKLNGDQADLLLAQYRAKALSRLPGEPLILDNRLELLSTDLGFSPQELLLVDAQEFNARVLASAFGVPPFALNLPLTGGLTYQNPAMMRDHWWWTELHTTSRRIATAVTAQMLPRGNAVVFDPTEWIHQGVPGTDQPLDSQTIGASPADQAANVTKIRPTMEVMA